MNKLKRTQLYDEHVNAGAQMAEFGGWEMPMHYQKGIISEHLFTRKECSIFDVSHMGRILIEGPERTAFLQHVLTSNVNALDLEQAQYSFISDENGSAIDDAYLYRFEEDSYVLIVNAANTEKDMEHLEKEIRNFDAAIKNVTAEWAAVAVQGPRSRDILQELIGCAQLTEPVKNSLSTLHIKSMENAVIKVAKTGYTGESIGYEVYVESRYAGRLWDGLIKLGAKPAGLGARDTLRMEAGMPLYGHELGSDISGEPMPIFAVSLARFAVSFSKLKGNYIGRDALSAQQKDFIRIGNRDFLECSSLPKKIMPIALLGRGVLRAGFAVMKDGRNVGYVTSGTMVPYYVTKGEGLDTVITEETGKRSIGFCYVDSDLITDDMLSVDVRGKLVDAVIPKFHMKNDAPPFSRIILYEKPEDEAVPGEKAGGTSAAALIKDATDNHIWRQEKCINLIPSEMSASRAVRILECSDPSFRYAEHRSVESFYDQEIFYYQGTGFIDRVERMLADEMRSYLGCSEVESRMLSGQMSNMCVYSALVDYKNRLDRKHEPRRLGYVLNNHIIKGGHLSAQPMGALRDYIAVDPVTEKKAVVNFPVMADDPYMIDTEATMKVIEEYKPELIIFGKSMVLYPEPVREIRNFVDSMGYDTTIMYDMAHVLGLIGDHFQDPFSEGADIVTGSTHKTFFGPQRGIIGANWKKEDLKYELWKSIQSRAFPGSTSNHHLGTQLALLMAAYEMNTFKDEYQRSVMENAKGFAKSLHEAGLNVEGDPGRGYTMTHQVIVSVGYGEGPEIAKRLEQNNIICNYQATPEEEGFTASGALRLGTAEMTRFGFGAEQFEELAGLMAECINKGTDVKKEVEKLRSGYTNMKYCFSDSQIQAALDSMARKTGL